MRWEQQHNSYIYLMEKVKDINIVRIQTEILPQDFMCTKVQREGVVSSQCYSFLNYKKRIVRTKSAKVAMVLYL